MLELIEAIEEQLMYRNVNAGSSAGAGYPSLATRPFVSARASVTLIAAIHLHAPNLLPASARPMCALH